MPLMAVVENLDDMDEADRGRYIEKTYKQKSTFRDGKEVPGQEVKRFVLDITGVEEHPNTIALQNALERGKSQRVGLQTELDTLKAKFAGLPEDFTVEQYETLKATAEAHDNAPDDETAEEKAKRLKQGEAAIKLLEQQMERLKNAKDAEIKKHVDALASANRFIDKLLIDEGLTRALSEVGVKPGSFMRAAKAMLRENCKVAGEGDERHAVYETSDIGEVELPKFVKDWANSDDGKEFVTKPKGGGAEGGEGDKRETGKNPFVKKGEPGYNLTEQGQIMKADPAKARRMQKEAGWSDAEITRGAREAQAA